MLRARCDNFGWMQAGGPGGGEEADWWAWPSGYSAKTEFNLIDGGTKLINGRHQALVKVEELRDANRAHLRRFADAGAGSSLVGLGGEGTGAGEQSGDGVDGRAAAAAEPPAQQPGPPVGFMAFNEVYAPVGPGGTGLVALFTRSRERQHLLHLLRLRDLVVDTLGLDGARPAAVVRLVVLPRDRDAGFGVPGGHGGGGAGGALAFTRAGEAALRGSLASGVRPQPWATAALGLDPHWLGAYVALGARRSGQTAHRLSEAISQV
jgi:hypothetical protein